MDRRRIVEQRFEDAPGLFDAVLSREAHAVTPYRVEQQHLVRRRSLSSLLGKLDVEMDRLGTLTVGAMGVEDQARARRGVQLDDDLVWLRAPAFVPEEAETGRMAEHGAQLCLRDGQALAGADEPRHARPAPVVDLEPQCRVRLG